MYKENAIQNLKQVLEYNRNELCFLFVAFWITFLLPIYWKQQNQPFPLNIVLLKIYRIMEI